MNEEGLLEIKKNNELSLLFESLLGALDKGNFNALCKTLRECCSAESIVFAIYDENSGEYTAKGCDFSNGRDDCPHDHEDAVTCGISPEIHDKLIQYAIKEWGSDSAFPRSILPEEAFAYLNIGKDSKIFSFSSSCEERLLAFFIVKTSATEFTSLEYITTFLSVSGAIIKHYNNFVEVKSDHAELEKLNAQMKAQQTQLIHSEKMASLGQLAAGVAHEINNPVGYVMSNIGTLKDYLCSYDKIIKMYEQIVSESTLSDKAKELQEELNEFLEDEDFEFIQEDAVQLLEESMEGTFRVRDIVQGLKGFARLDDSGVKFANINEGVETTLKIVWNELKYKCKVEKVLGDIPCVACNLGQLNQVIMNLLVNASHAIVEDGVIKIETGVTDTEVFFKVSDNGCGIPEDVRNRIFDPFFTTKAVGKGTGLGLALAHGIIEEHNGRIEVESTVGVGTTFTVYLPLEIEADED